MVLKTSPKPFSGLRRCARSDWNPSVLPLMVLGLGSGFRAQGVYISILFGASMRHVRPALLSCNETLYVT